MEASKQPRLEDPRLITGRGHYVDDINYKNQAYMGIVRSPVAHAKIKKIDLSNIISDPNFIAAITGGDLLKEGVSPITQNQWPPQKQAPRYHLAVGKIRFVGEPVAAILARNKYSVEDLLEKVTIDYEPLPVITTIQESKAGKALLYEEWGNNITQQDETKWGDADKAISSAAYVINSKESIARQVAAPIEPRAVAVRYDKDDDTFEVHSTVQSVHGLRHLLASELKLPIEKFHVQILDVGGGFGSKGAQSYPEAPLACILSKKTGLPVKWTATRTEEFLEAASGRDEYCDVTLACGKDGKLLALKGKLESDAGVSGTQNHMSMLTIWSMIGLYGLRNVDMKMEAYVTNKMPIGPVRGAGAPEGCYFIERAIDLLARKTGIDPIEFRRRNLSKQSAGNISGLFDTLVESSRYQDLLKWKNEINSKFRNSDSRILAGIGISARGGGGFGGGRDESGGGNRGSQSDQGLRHNSGNDSSQTWQGNESGENSKEWNDSEGDDEEEQGVAGFMTETAKITMDDKGKVTVYTGSSPHGQGHETTFAQLASEELGVSIQDVKIVWGDTEQIPVGTGTFGSRSAATGGSAVVDASRKLKALIISKAAEVLGVDKNSLAVENGELVNGTERKLLASILKQLNLSELSAESSFTLNEMSHSNTVHLCALTVDVKQQKISISKYVIVEDPGRVINRAIVEGQLHGGVVHAIGGALYERLVYDDAGNLLTSTFLDYDIPAAQESPNIEVYLRGTPSMEVLDGAKGVGESGTIAGYAAVINALNDALAELTNSKDLSAAPATQESIYRAAS